MLKNAVTFVLECVLNGGEEEDKEKQLASLSD
jgi:hypothetical protein